MQVSSPTFKAGTALLFGLLGSACAWGQAPPPLSAVATTPGDPAEGSAEDGDSQNASDLLEGYPPLAANGLVHVVVEIPTGTNEKWQVSKATGHLEWEMKEGNPRVVRYLGYPGNYGMVPRTLLPLDRGGDGDPLDVIVLGPPVPRGSVLAVRLIGVLELLDDGEQDDKLIAIAPGSPMASALSIDDLQRDFPGVLDILSLWFSHYKGHGVTQVSGTAGPGRAQATLDMAMESHSLRSRN